MNFHIGARGSMSLEMLLSVSGAILVAVVGIPVFLRLFAELSCNFHETEGAQQECRASITQ